MYIWHLTNANKHSKIYSMHQDRNFAQKEVRICAITRKNADAKKGTATEAA